MAEERDKQSSGNMRSLAETPYQVHSEQRGQSSGIQRGTGADWFGPLNPLEPIAPDEVAGRTFDIPSGYNLNIQPRAYEQVTFGQLRAFADGYDLLRLVIETRKDQMSKMNWNIVPRDPKKRKQGGSFAAEIQEIERFLLRPDGVNFWGDWLRTVLEDLLVLDAPSIYRRRTYGGQLYALEPIDGATIKRVIDDWGRTPNPPTPAYQQVLKGFPAIDYTTNDLIYRPRNQRTHKVYGFSPVEQIIMTVNIGIRRQVWQLQSFTEGNIPEALIGTPDNWTPDQIRSFQDWFDAMLEGNTGERRRARFVPGEISKGYIATKPSELFGAAEEWLARIVCYAFGISPQPFVAMMNRATAETAQEAAAQEGLAPIMQWVKNLVDTIIIDDFGNFDLEFQWNDEEELDPNVKSQIIDREVAAGLLTLNEGRAEKGLDPYDHPDADRPMFRAATGYAPILPTPEEQKRKEEMTAAIGGKEAPSSEGSSPLSSGEGAPEEEEGEEEEEPAEKADKSGYKPPSGVRSAAKRGLELREKWGRGGIDNSEASAEGIGSGVQRATNLKNGDSISLATIKRMKSFFSRHQKNYNPDKKESDGGPTAGTIAWLLWGGNAGKAWVESILSSEEKAEKSDGYRDLAKVGVGDDYVPETAPPPEGTFVDPERDAGRKAEREMRMAFTRHLRSMGRKVSNQAAELLREKGLAKADPSEEDVDAIINSLSTITFADMQGDITEILQSIYASAGTEALGQIGVEVTDDLVNVVNQSAVSWAERHAADLVGVSKNPVYALTDSTRDMLRSTITKGLRDNLSAEGIAKEIMSSHAFSADRAEIIAMTEIRHANSMGAVEGYKEAEDLGIKVKKRWYNMEAACSICTANGAAGAIDLSENFPSGNGSPPGHPNCRCVIVPEVEE